MSETKNCTCNLIDTSCTSWVLFLFFFFFWSFLGLHLRHMDIPQLGVESELQLPAHTTATATKDPSHVCNPHHRSQQRWILNPLSEAWDGTHNLMVPSWIRFCCTTAGTSHSLPSKSSQQRTRFLFFLTKSCSLSLSSKTPAWTAYWECSLFTNVA